MAATRMVYGKGMAEAWIVHEKCMERHYRAFVPFLPNRPQPLLHERAGYLKNTGPCK